MTVGFVLAFLQAQESDLRTEPATYIVSRGYEIGTPQVTLQGLNLNLPIVEFPDPQTQLLILKSNEVQDEISKRLGLDISVQTPDSFETPATFTCNQPIVADCERAIEAYVLKAAEIRQQAIATGIEKLQKVLGRLDGTSDDPLIPRQIAALDALSKDLNVPFILVDGFEQSVGPTVENVRRPTVVIGIASGVLISLLILLQLTFVDSRVRSVRQLVRLVGSSRYLGLTTTKPDSVRDRRTAMSVRSGLNAGSKTTMRMLMIKHELSKSAGLERIAELSGAETSFSKPMSHLTIKEIGNPTNHEADILIVQRNRDLRRDVIDAVTMLERSGRYLAGVLLVG